MSNALKYRPMDIKTSKDLRECLSERFYNIDAIGDILETMSEDGTNEVCRLLGDLCHDVVDGVYEVIDEVLLKGDEEDRKAKKEPQT